MDTKLARGLTRQGFRRDEQTYMDESDDYVSLWMGSLKSLRFRGKIKKEDGVETMQRSIAVANDSMRTVFAEALSLGNGSKLSKNFDLAIVGGHLGTGSIPIKDWSEKVRGYSLFWVRSNRKALDMRTTRWTLYIREHAIHRYVERSDASYETLARSLWPGALAFEALNLLPSAQFERPFVLASQHGMFLAELSIQKSPRSLNIDRVVTTENGIEEKNLSKGYPGAVPILYINTYISHEEMSDLQHELWELLRASVQRHKSILTASHIRRLSYLTDLDDFIEHSYSGDTEAARTEFQYLFGSDLWRRAVRQPNRTG